MGVLCIGYNKEENRLILTGDINELKRNKATSHLMKNENFVFF